LFDVTHYETLKNSALKEHIDHVGVLIYDIRQCDLATLIRT
jgi:hypothetical protein